LTKFLLTFAPSTKTTATISKFLLLWAQKREFSVVKYYLLLVFRNLFSSDDLILHGDIGFGAEQQFENEARMALRLANFLSAFLQVIFIFIFVLNFR
jgi:hypothetical protein